MSRASIRIPDDVAALAPYVAAGVFGAADVHVADLIVRAARHEGLHDPDVIAAVALAAAAATWAPRHGHSCVDLAGVPSATRREAGVEALDSGPADTGRAPLTWPNEHEWLRGLHAATHVVRVVDRHDDAAVLDHCPLVAFGSRVYLQRHWIDECAVATSLRARAVDDPLHLTADDLALFDRLLEPFDEPLPADGAATTEATAPTDPPRSRQRLAAEVAVHSRLAIVVGGPGTGKTFTVGRLLALLLHRHGTDGAPLRIALAAPTGKAAARLEESIRAVVDEAEQSVPPGEVPSPLAGDDMAHVRRALRSLEATTIHRMLGSWPDVRQRFRHDAAQPLEFDVVVIDEMSMVAAPLMARLCEALGATTRLVLVGDPGQLESVEQGAVLVDIVGVDDGDRDRDGTAVGPSPAPTSPLIGRVVRLTRPRRFGAGSPIAMLADAVQDGRADAVEALFRSAASSELRVVDVADPHAPAALGAVREVLQPVLDRLRVAAEAGDVSAALDAASVVRILCAHRLGAFGVASWNRRAEQWMLGNVPVGAYAGRTVLATRNDLRLGLVNGETGVVVRRGEGLVAAFGAPHEHHFIELTQLDNVETAFATTVHKSQGSEFDDVVVVLPPERSPLVGRELLYTAITRARRRLLLVGTTAAATACVRTSAGRMTGLCDALAAGQTASLP